MVLIFKAVKAKVDQWILNNGKGLAGYRVLVLVGKYNLLGA